MIKQRNGKYFFRPSTSKRENQQTKIFKLLMNGRKLTRIESVSLAQCYKLPTRISEINDALTDLMGAPFEVSSESLTTSHNGHVYRYFLTLQQREAIENKLSEMTVAA